MMRRSKKMAAEETVDTTSFVYSYLNDKFKKIAVLYKQATNAKPLPNGYPSLSDLCMNYVKNCLTSGPQAVGKQEFKTTKAYRDSDTSDNEDSDEELRTSNNLSTTKVVASSKSINSQKHFSNKMAENDSKKESSDSDSEESAPKVCVPTNKQAIVSKPAAAVQGTTSKIRGKKSSSSSSDSDSEPVSKSKAVMPKAQLAKSALKPTNKGDSTTSESDSEEESAPKSQVPEKKQPAEPRRPMQKVQGSVSLTTGRESSSSDSSESDSEPSSKAKALAPKVVPSAQWAKSGPKPANKGDSSTSDSDSDESTAQTQAVVKKQPASPRLPQKVQGTTSKTDKKSSSHSGSEPFSKSKTVTPKVVLSAQLAKSIPKQTKARDSSSSDNDSEEESALKAQGPGKKQLASLMHLQKVQGCASKTITQKSSSDSSSESDSELLGKTKATAAKPIPASVSAKATVKEANECETSSSDSDSEEDTASKVGAPPKKQPTAHESGSAVPGTASKTTGKKSADNSSSGSDLEPIPKLKALTPKVVPLAKSIPKQAKKNDSSSSDSDSEEESAPRVQGLGKKQPVTLRPVRKAQDTAPKSVTKESSSDSSSESDSEPSGKAKVIAQKALAAPGLDKSTLKQARAYKSSSSDSDSEEESVPKASILTKKQTSAPESTAAVRGSISKMAGKKSSSSSSDSDSEPVSKSKAVMPKAQLAKSALKPTNKGDSTTSESDSEEESAPKPQVPAKKQPAEPRPMLKVQGSVSLSIDIESSSSDSSESDSEPSSKAKALAPKVVPSAQWAKSGPKPANKGDSSTSDSDSDEPTAQTQAVVKKQPASPRPLQKVQGTASKADQKSSSSSGSSDSDSEESGKEKVMSLRTIPITGSRKSAVEQAQPECNNSLQNINCNSDKVGYVAVSSSTAPKQAKKRKKGSSCGSSSEGDVPKGKKPVLRQAIENVSSGSSSNINSKPSKKGNPLNSKTVSIFQSTEVALKKVSKRKKPETSSDSDSGDGTSKMKLSKAKELAENAKTSKLLAKKDSNSSSSDDDSEASNKVEHLSCKSMPGLEVNNKTQLDLKAKLLTSPKTHVASKFITNNDSSNSDSSSEDEAEGRSVLNHNSEDKGKVQKFSGGSESKQVPSLSVQCNLKSLQPINGRKANMIKNQGNSHEISSSDSDSSEDSSPKQGTAHGQNTKNLCKVDAIKNAVTGSSTQLINGASSSTSKEKHYKSHNCNERKEYVPTISNENASSKISTSVLEKSICAEEFQSSFVKKHRGKTSTPVFSDGMQKSDVSENVKNVPFRRVQVEKNTLDPRLRDNSFEAKKGARGSWGERANDTLKYKRGKDFRHEKVKKKRGSYFGGTISTEVNSIKFED